MAYQLSRDHSLALRGACLSLLALPMTVGIASAQTPFACTGEAFIIQEVPDAELIQIDQTVDPFAFLVLDIFPSTEINNLGFHRGNGVLYALQLTGSGNGGIMRIDGAGIPTSLGSGTPALPNLRFDAGDVSPDGTIFYVNRSGSGAIYSVPLPALSPITSETVSGATGFVFDWAAHPSNGLLYGGDRDGGQLAVLDPATGARTDMAVNGCAVIMAGCSAAALPGGGAPVAFGGAWFNAAENLFLYENSGQIFEIDLSGTPTIVATQSGPGSSRNDGAACIQDVLGAAKRMTSSDETSLFATYTIDYVFENLSSASPTDNLSNLSAIDDLTAVFGTPDVDDSGDDDWNFVSISSVPIGFANASFNGGDGVVPDTELIAAAQALTAPSSATVTVTVEVRTLANLNMDGEFCNQVLFQGENEDGTLFGDFSHDDGTSPPTSPDPDPNADGSPDERELTCVLQMPVSLMTFSVD